MLRQTYHIWGAGSLRRRPHGRNHARENLPLFAERRWFGSSALDDPAVEQTDRGFASIAGPVRPEVVTDDKTTRVALAPQHPDNRALPQGRSTGRVAQRPVVVSPRRGRAMAAGQSRTRSAPVDERRG